MTTASYNSSHYRVYRNTPLLHLTPAVYIHQFFGSFLGILGYRCSTSNKGCSTENMFLVLICNVRIVFRYFTSTCKFNQIITSYACTYTASYLLAAGDESTSFIYIQFTFFESNLPGNKYIMYACFKYYLSSG